MKLPSLARAALSLVVASCAAFGAQAAEQPTRLVVGFQAGGGLDAVARSLADTLSRTGTQRVIVENRPGASGMIAIDAVRNAKPGESMLVILPSGSITMTPHTNRNFSYDPERDLVPVARVATYSLGLAVFPGAEVGTLAELLERAGSTPAMRAYGTAGVGLSPHYIGVKLAESSKADLVHVPYKGAGPAINDTLGGQIPAVISTVPSLLSFWRDGRLKLLATSGSKRDPNAQDVPTFVELGHEGIELEEWFGVLAPADTPPEVARRWNAAINEALASEALRDALLAQGFVPAPMSQPDFRELVLADYRHWQELLEGTGDTFAN